jgi:hypothetical protein
MGEINSSRLRCNKCGDSFIPQIGDSLERCQVCDFYAGENRRYVRAYRQRKKEKEMEQFLAPIFFILYGGKLGNNSCTG